MSTIDIGVAVRQGVYYRPDAQAYLNDYDHREWLIKHKGDGYRVTRGNRTATLTKARREHPCAICPEPIAKGDHYRSITYNGAGLGSIKFPERVHLGCLKGYWEKR